MILAKIRHRPTNEVILYRLYTTWRSAEPETRLNDITITLLASTGVYLMFYGIIWLWSDIWTGDYPAPNVYPMYQVSHNLQAKIGAPQVLARLANCLQESIPDRNATITDFSTCLKAMGMNASYME
jgi:hypothetical protein